VAALAAAGAGAAYLWFLRAVDAPGPLAAEAQLVIPRGTGMEGIARQLEGAGVLTDHRLFLALAWLERPVLKAGEYRFPANTSLRAAMALLAEGRTVIRRLTVPEGLTSTRVLALVQNAEGLSGTVASVPAEGALLPETWNYAWGDDRAALLARMMRARDDVLADLWPKRAPNLPLKTAEEALVLASIVEKETAVAAERPLVAGVFINRLRRNMRLQSDPTVVYGAQPGNPAERSPTRAELDQANAWNTYRIDGLPPSPIANPGRASIAAVLNPATHDYFYFVADGAGGHAFARTLDEHNRNVARWRRLQSGN
jgi:UPF0755 protein